MSLATATTANPRPARRTRKPKATQSEASMPETPAVEPAPADSAIEPADLAPGQLTVSQFDVTRHDATVTVFNPSTGQHRTFRVETLRGDWNPGKRVVGLLTGSDNTSDYTRFAFVDDFGVKVWRRFRSDDPVAGPSEWERFARLLERPSVYEAKGAEYLIAACCRRCGRLLTDETSILTGLGPVCREKV